MSDVQTLERPGTPTDSPTTSQPQPQPQRAASGATAQAQPGRGSPQVPPAKADSRRYADAALMPPVDVIEDAHGITLFADLPGVPRDKLHLQVEADTLTIDADMEMTLPEHLQSVHTEVGVARFHRVFTLSKELDTEKVSAELSNGVLKLSIPKAEHAKPRRVAVRTA